jgi:hypothetical protein
MYVSAENDDSAVPRKLRRPAEKPGVPDPEPGSDEPPYFSSLSFFISATKRGSERSESKVRSFLSHPSH